MPEAAQADTAPVVTDTAPDTSSNQQTSQQTTTTDTDMTGQVPDVQTTTTTTAETQTTQAEDFSLPEAYRDKPWAAKIKSQDDVYKQLENLNSLVGKKTITPIDYEKATPEEIAEYHKTLAPEDASQYSFGDDPDPEFSSAVGSVFQEAGLTKYQGDLIASKVNEIAAGMVEAQQNQSRDMDEYKAMLQESFGDNFAQIAKYVDGNIAKFATPEDREFFDSISDNKTRAAVDRVLFNVLKQYGVKETGSQADGGEGGVMKMDVASVRADLRNQMREMDSKPHTAEQKQELIDKLAATYK